jgi:hypothetical protein
MLDESPRARTISELIDAAFSLYRRDASAYIMVTAIASVPGLIAQLILMRPATDVTAAAAFGAIIVGIVSLVTYALMTGVVTKVGSDVYLGGQADVAAAVRHTVPLIGTLIWAGIMRAIIFMLYTILLFFPLFIAFAKYFGVEAAVVLEQKSAGESLSRSSELSDGLKWHVFRTLLLGYGIYFLLAVALGVLGAFFPGQVVSLFIQTLATIIAYPIVGLLSMLLYYDARIRKEGFDMEHLSRALGNSAAAAAR